MRDAIASLTSEVGAAMRDHQVHVLIPNLVTNPHFPTQSSVGWSDSVVGATVACSLQPANLEAVQAAGLDAARDLQQLHADPVGLTPEGRVRIGDFTYRVLRARAYATHTSALLEAITDTEAGS